MRARAGSRCASNSVRLRADTLPSRRHSASSTRAPPLVSR